MLSIRNNAAWQQTLKILSTMYQNPALPQIMKDIKSWDKNSKQIIFRDYQSMQAFVDYLKKKNIIK